MGYKNTASQDMCPSLFPTKMFAVVQACALPHVAVLEKNASPIWFRQAEMIWDVFSPIPSTLRTSVSIYFLRITNSLLPITLSRKPAFCVCVWPGCVPRCCRLGCGLCTLSFQQHWLLGKEDFAYPTLLTVAVHTEYLESLSIPVSVPICLSLLLSFLSSRSLFLHPSFFILCSLSISSTPSYLFVFLSSLIFVFSFLFRKMFWFNQLQY